jgi:hypothetical protein
VGVALLAREVIEHLPALITLLVDAHFFPIPFLQSH